MSIEEVMFKIKQKIVYYDNLSQTAEKPLDKYFAVRQKEAIKSLLEELEG